MTERRWDIVLRIASGPDASREPKVYRGPRVTVGTTPGTGGVILPRGRGIAGEHCTISAYDPHTVFVTPSGPNPVRVAPYTNVHWEELEPITGRVRLQRGNAVHLGPTGQRGVTLEFIECRDLGMQTVGRIASDTADAAIFTRPPDGIRARAKRPEIRQLLTDTYDAGTFRVLIAMLVGGSGVLLMLAVALIAQILSPRLTQEGDVEWKVMDFEFSPVFEMHQGFEQAFLDLIIDPDRRYAKDTSRALLPEDPKGWDPRFLQSVQYSMDQMAKGRCLFRLLENKHDQYRDVVNMLDEADLPEVFAGIPMIESQYDAAAISPCCAVGWWQFMPEFGVRLKSLGGRYAVKNCHYAGALDAPTFSPAQPAPPRNACHPTRPTAEYIESDGTNARCLLSYCDDDFRTDLELSTKAAIYTLGQALADPELSASGAAVQIAIASHNAGYDDAALFPGREFDKPKNMLPAYRRWLSERDAATSTAWFHGQAQQCTRDVEDPAACERYMMRETQRYAPNVVAAHLLAMCYYARNYKTERAFGQWGKYWGEGGYCHGLNVPSAQEAASLCMRRK